MVMLCSTAAEGDGRAVILGVVAEAIEAEEVVVVAAVPPALASAVSTFKDGEPVAVADPPRGKNSLDDATEVGLVDFRPVLIVAVGLNNLVVVVE